MTFLVVFEDYRNGNGDIYGQMITPEGNLKNSSIPICTNEASQTHPAIASIDLKMNILLSCKTIEMAIQIFTIRALIKTARK